MKIKSMPVYGFISIVLGLCLPVPRTSAADDVVAGRTSFSLAAAKPQTLTEPQASAADASNTTGVIAANKKSIAFHQKSIRLAVHTGPGNDMLSYRIDGLRNPTLVVPRASTLKVLFINNDDDMFHDIRFGAWQSAFPTSAGGLIKASVGSDPLPHIDGTTMHATDMVIKAPSQAGKYAYFCTVRGHAPGGMWGIVEVR